MTYGGAINILKSNLINATGTLGALPSKAAERSHLHQQIDALNMAIEALELATRAENINYKTVSKCITVDYCHGWNEAVRKLKGEEV